MLKKLVHSLFFVFAAFIAVSQPIGDEWIDYNKKYLKIPCWQDGLYGITYSQLNSSMSSVGESISSLQLDELELFRQGEKVAFYINGDADNQLEAGEEIWFVGKANDGTFDSSLYLNSEQLHTYYSLFNDTAHYFLTWGGTARRYEEIQVQSSATNLAYVWRKELQLYTNSYQYGARNFFGSTDPEYRAGEGFYDGSTGSGSFGYLRRRVKNVPSNNVYRQAGAPSARIKSGLVPVIGSRHNIKLEYGLGSFQGQTISWLGSNFKVFEFNIPVANLGTSQTPFEFTSLATLPPPENNTANYAISHFELDYPHNMNLNNASNFKFYVENQNDSFKLVFSSALAGTYFLFNHKEARFASSVSNAGQLEFNLAPGQNLNFELYHQSAIQAISGIKAAGTNGSFTNYSAIAPDSAFIIISHPKLISATQSYAQYKSSKNYKSIVINVNDLYDQYAYGINKHPLAIKNLCRRALESWSSKPEYLFLIGKGISSHLTRKNNTNYQNNLVPTFGYPSCDNLFTTRIDSSLFDPKIPTGRLSVRNGQEVLDYLQKVQEFDLAIDSTSSTIAEQIWKKRILHFAGGTSELEQNLFENYLNNYSKIAEDSAFAGEVFTFFKNSAAAVQTEISDSVKLLIDDGVALMTFFGHGAGGQLGFSIGDPESYENEAKYPFMIANSCNVGNIYLEDVGSKSLNEEYVLAKQRGVIGFIASVENGYPYNLDEYTTAFYRNFARRHYGSGIGKLMQQTVLDIQRDAPIVKWTCLEMNLHGDPSLSLYPMANSELSVESNSISFMPEKLSVDLDSFLIKIEVLNTGKSSSETFVVRLHHQSAAGLDTVYRHFQQGINASAEIVFSIPLDKQLMPGENYFELELDLPENVVIEKFETENNRVSFDILITSDELIPIFPANFAIIPDSAPSLVAYTSEMNAPRREYYFQVDTTDSYDSPILEEKLLVSDGGIVRWSPAFEYWKDSVVYFWRCSPNNFYAKDMKWRERSFQYIESKSGRGQASYNQFKNNRFQFLDYQREARKSEFIPVSRKLSMRNRGNPSFGAEFQELYDIWFRLDGVIQGQGVCAARPSMHIAVIDPISLECWQTTDLQLGQFNESGSCANFLPKQFMFNVMANDDLDSMVSLIENHIPDGHYIFAFSGINAHFQDTSYWHNNHFTAFESLGADSIRYAPNDNPYIFFCQKGDLQSATEVIGQNSKDVINLEKTLSSRSSFGFIESPSFRNIDSIELFSGKIVSSTNDVRSASLIESDELQYSIESDSWYVDSTGNFEVNELKVRFRFEDGVNRTAPQLKYWHILGPELPELAINPQLSNGINANYFQEGDSIDIHIGIENISTIDMPQHKIRIQIKKPNEEAQLLYYGNQSAIIQGSNVILEQQFSTAGLFGSYMLYYEVNPKDTNWVKELEHFNNKIEYSFYVEEDRLNPILDVRFDGRYIQNNQYVEAQPEISFDIFDNNQYLALDDSSNFSLWFAKEEEDYRAIYHNTGEILAIQKDSNINTASYLYLPNLEPGEYKLKAMASDSRGIESGSSQYEIHFKVQDTKEVSNISVYPNPFRNSTSFTLDLKGAEVPSDLNLEITSAEGRVVKSIDISSSEDIRIGPNKLSIYWDGTDATGESLPSGSYFYRLNSDQLNLEDQSIIQRSGKIILLK